jgi:hypothetical protein
VLLFRYKWPPGLSAVHLVMGWFILDIWSVSCTLIIGRYRYIVGMIAVISGDTDIIVHQISCYLPCKGTTHFPSADCSSKCHCFSISGHLVCPQECIWIWEGQHWQRQVFAVNGAALILGCVGFCFIVSAAISVQVVIQTVSENAFGYGIVRFG